jgi:hypothetical protein
VRISVFPIGKGTQYKIEIYKKGDERKDYPGNSPLHGYLIEVTFCEKGVGDENGDQYGGNQTTDSTLEVDQEGQGKSDRDDYFDLGEVAYRVVYYIEYLLKNGRKQSPSPFSIILYSVKDKMNPLST